MKTFAIVDLETTGNAAAKGDRIIEIGIVLLNQNGQFVQEFSSLVYPERDIPAFISSLTGIKDEDVLDAPLFSEIVETIYPLVEESYIVAHNIEFDLGFLNEEFARCGYPPLQNPIIDTVELSRVLLPMSPSFKLGQLSEQLDMGHDNPHRALSDAKATSDLLNYLLKKLESLPERTLEYLMKIEARLKSDLRPFIKKSIEQNRYGSAGTEEFELWHGIPVKKSNVKRLTYEQDLSSVEEWMAWVFESKSGLKKWMDGYEYRTGQKEMSLEVYRSLKQKRHAILEVGAGTGKSLAYLVAALYYANKYEERVLVTTHTTNLQKQLLEHEVPRLERLFKDPFQVVLYKGRSHYISLVHFKYELENTHQDNYDLALAKAMTLVWLTETETGDLDELQLPSNGRQFWHKISSEQASKTVTLDADDTSFYQRAKKKAESAHVVITNHALFSVDLISDEQKLPSYERVIIDEAHHLEPVANRYFGIQFNYKEIQRRLSQLTDLFQRSVYTGLSLSDTFHTSVSECQDKVNESKDELSQFSKYIFQALRRRQKSRSKSDIGRIQFLVEEDEPASFLEPAREMCDRFLSSLGQLYKEMEKMRTEIAGLSHVVDDMKADVLRTRLEGQIEFCMKVRNQLNHFFAFKEESHVRWIEVEGGAASHSVYLFSEPLNVSERLRKLLFDIKESVVLTSATLSTNGTFDYVKKTWGIDDITVTEKSIDSPYAFQNQVQLMVPNDFPNVKANQDEYIEAVCEAIHSIAHVTKGRMLVLFTSYDMLKKSYLLLKEFIDPEEFMIFAQGVSSGSRDRLKKNFQAFDQSILLGTSSFWEGVDIPGDDLSCLMMVRLPFQPPDQPTHVRRDTQMKAEGKNPFMEHSLPHAILRFKQGFGRLIRSDKDRGIVFICDQRIMEARYGKYFLSSIPDVPVTHQSTRVLIDKIEQWL
ncbi:ATP-dependent helicase DinG [Halobacillus fulvus]|nr:ATP-dependent helicase DinG [Halobacillus fulvus]